MSQGLASRFRCCGFPVSDTFRMDKAYVRMRQAFIVGLIEQLFPKARAELLRLLFTDPVRSLHLRDLARLSGLAVGTIQREVAHLRDAGIAFGETRRQSPLFLCER